VIKRSTRRIEQQRKTRLERKTKLKVQPKTALPAISPLPKAHPPKVPVFNPSPVVPTFSLQTLKSFDMAVKGLKAQGRSLHQRLLICHHHLRSDPALSGIDPRELLKELNSQN
jgi:hypothetical protein